MISLRHISYFISFLLLTVFVSLVPDSASAQALFNSGTNFLNALVDVLTNTWVRIIGIIAVAALGIAWLAGRISMGWVIGVVGGLVLVFGAAAIVDSVASVV